MSRGKRLKHRNKAVVAGLATAAALAGGVGVAAASGPPSTADNAAATNQAPSPEQPKATEQPGGTGRAEGTEQEPSLNGSVPVQEVKGETEQQEGARLSKDAKVSQSEAEAAALRAVPGKATASELGNENGSLIWEVDVQKPDGSSGEVKVDAGNGTVLAQEASDEGGEGAAESQDGEQDGAGDRDEPGEATTG